MATRDFAEIPRGYLYCRAWQHAWYHSGGAEDPDIIRVVRDGLAFWFTKGRCTSCGTERTRYFQPRTCEPYNNWAYAHNPDWRLHMHGVTQMDARRELARRARVSGAAPRLKSVQEAG